MTKRVIIFGAGATGRGHVGEIGHEAGWQLVLVDKDQRLVDALRRAGRYTVHLHTAKSSRSVTVTGYRAYHVDECEPLIKEALDVPLVLTAVFAHNLGGIAPLIAQMISARREAGIESPLNVVCCENMPDSSTTLKSLIEPLLPPQDVAYAGRHIGFPDCMVSRVVPVTPPPAVDLVAEDYNEWTVDAPSFVGPPLDLPGMELVTNQEERFARKFFMHNGAHAVCAYWGFHRRHPYIHEALADDFVLARVLQAIDELAPVVARRYGFDAESVRQYGLELGPRGATKELMDSISRVVRDPLRKLGRTERLVAPAELALEFGLPCDRLVETIAAVLHYYREDDPQAVRMREMIEAEAPEAAIPQILGLPGGHALALRVVDAYRAWRPPDPG